jgi:uncharacterized protein (TIGR00730 family)
MPSDLNSVCVFCGCNRGADPGYLRAAESVGRLLAGQGIGLVYGGAQSGLMGAVADAALAVGGRVTGVLPRGMMLREPPHEHLSELLVVDTMHERKALMAQRSDAFLALPGGLGTLEEAAETISWTQLGLQHKPTGFLNVNGFFDPLRAQLDHMVAENFVLPEHRNSIYFDDQPEKLLELLGDFEPSRQHKWIDQAD